MTEERFNAILAKLAETGELDNVCPFADIVLPMEDGCLEYEQCRRCSWRGFDSAEALSVAATE